MGAVGNEFQLAGLDLGAVLGVFEVAHLGDELVGGAVETLHLRVQRVDETPEQAFAFVGELGAGGALKLLCIVKSCWRGVLQVQVSRKVRAGVGLSRGRRSV